MRSRARQISGLVGTCFRAHSGRFSPRPHLGNQQGVSGLSYGGADAGVRAPPPDTSTWAVRFPLVNLGAGGTNVQPVTVTRSQLPGTGGGHLWGPCCLTQPV